MKIDSNRSTFAFDQSLGHQRQAAEVQISADVTQVAAGLSGYWYPQSGAMNSTYRI